MITYFAATQLPMDEQFDQLTELKLGKGEKVQALFNKLMKKTEKLDITEAQKVALFKRGLPKYIKRYIKQERPTTLLDTLQKAKEAEELGPDHDGHEDIKGLQDYVTATSETGPTGQTTGLGDVYTGATKVLWLQKYAAPVRQLPDIASTRKYRTRP